MLKSPFSILSKVFKWKNNKKNNKPQKDESEDILESQNLVKKPQNVKNTDEDWTKNEFEGQLAIDVYQTELCIILKVPIAGVKPEDLDISINNDLITIRGSRHLEEEIEAEDYFYQECYWGNFSRSVILPVECLPEQTEASFKNGVLTIKIPKLKRSQTIPLKIIEE